VVDLIGPNDLDDHQGQQIVIPGQVSLIAMAASESLDRHTPGSISSPCSKSQLVFICRLFRWISAEG